MNRGIHANILGAVAFLGLLVAVGRPLVKLQDEASWQGSLPPVFAVELPRDAGYTRVPVVSVP